MSWSDKEKQKIWYDANREEINANRRAAYWANKTKHQEKARVYYLENKAEIDAKQAAYREQTPHLKRAYSMKRSGCRHDGIRFELSQDEFERLKTTPNCQACNAELTEKTSQLDQIRPGQGYWLGNVGVLCRRCNAIKQDATPDQIRAVADYAEKSSSFPGPTAENTKYVNTQEIQGLSGTQRSHPNPPTTDSGARAAAEPQQPITNMAVDERAGLKGGQ